MSALPGADGRRNNDERGSETAVMVIFCFLTAECWARNNITSSPVRPHAALRASLSLPGDDGVLLFQTCCNENKHPRLGVRVLITRHFMLHFDFIRIKWLFFFLL